MTLRARQAAFEALDVFMHGELERVEVILDSAIQEERARADIEDVLSLCCMRASIAAMEGSHNVAALMKPAAGSPQHAAVRCYLEGFAALANANLRTAQLMFDEAARRDPQFVLVHLGLAAVHYQQGHYKNSFSEYRKVLSVLGSTVTPSIVRVGMGLCAYHLHRLEDARKLLERALELNPKHGLALLALLVVYLDRRLVRKVTEVVERLREALPHNAMVLLKVADLMYFKAIGKKQTKSAVRSVMSVLNEVRCFGSVEECGLADFQEGRLLLAAGDLPAAQSLLEAALRTFPKLLAARVHYARLLILSHREDEAAQLLEKINKDQPNQKEVLQLLAVHATRLGQHEKALKYCSLLVNSVAPGDLRSWSLAAWCTRLDTVECQRLHAHVIRAYREMGLVSPWQLQSNLAVLSNDADSLQALVDEHLGGNFLNQHDFSVQYVPLVFNLALLLEELDRTRARQLYIFLVKHQSGFRMPYLRLHELAKRDGLYRQAVAWLTLLQQVIPHEPMAHAALGHVFFGKKKYTAAINILTNPRSKSVPVALALGATYLWLCQQYDKDNRQYLKLAKDRYSYVLQKDSGNILAAHGLACCVGLERKCDCCQSLLKRVSEVTPNSDYVRENHLVHMANIKVLSERYKQAIDYLEKVPQRTLQCDSSYAFCLASEGFYDKAIDVVSQAIANAEPHRMLVYNMSLLCCCAFLRHVSTRCTLNLEEGRKLRGTLESGLTAAAKFVEQEAKSRSQVENRAFLKSVCAYCIHVYDTYFKRLIVLGQESNVMQEKASELWRDTFATFRTEIQRDEEQNALVEIQKKAEQETYVREILENFRKSHCFYIGARMEDVDLPDSVIEDMELRSEPVLRGEDAPSFINDKMPASIVDVTDEDRFKS